MPSCGRYAGLPNIQKRRDKKERNVSLDIHLNVLESVEVYWGNVTHNLSRMAEAAGIYDYLWQAKEHNITTASQLIPYLRGGLAALHRDPGYFQLFNPRNGWGTYEGFVEFVAGTLAACEEYPAATVRVSC